MNRRSILRKAGAGVAGSLGVAGIASARSVDGPAIDPDHLRAALLDDADLLADLAADGLIDEASPDEFPLEASARPGTREDGVFLAPAWIDGVKKQVPTVGRNVDGGYLTITYDPDADLVVADLRTADGEFRRYGDDVGTADECSSDSDCESVCDSDCYTCVCTCDSCGIDCCSGFTCSCECNKCL